jgi:hypothetical protein
MHNQKRTKKTSTTYNQNHGPKKKNKNKSQNFSLSFQLHSGGWADVKARLFQRNIFCSFDGKKVIFLGSLRHYFCWEEVYSLYRPLPMFPHLYFISPSSNTLV